MTNYYTTPDEKSTTSIKRYLKEWDALKEPLEREFDLVCIGFDPGLLMRPKLGGKAIDIPVWFAKRLVKLLEKTK